MMWLRVSLLLFLFVPTEARGDGAVVDAERVRLSGEIERLASRQVWNGVERKYQELMALDVALESSDHLYGAHAARELGDIEACHERLLRVVESDSSREVIDWLWDIDNNYGHVMLRTSSPRAAVLERVNLPFDPVQRRAIEAAIELAGESAEFSGLLPLGTYIFAGQEFQVRPGVSVSIEVSPRARRNSSSAPVIVYRDEPDAPSVEGEHSDGGEVSTEESDE